MNQIEIHAIEASEVAETGRMWRRSGEGVQREIEARMGPERGRVAPMSVVIAPASEIRPPWPLPASDAAPPSRDRTGFRHYFDDHFPARSFIGSGTLLRKCHFEINAIAVRG